MADPSEAEVATIDVRVTAKWNPAEGVVALELGLLEEGEVPSWDPGAHIDLHLPDGKVRQYSLCGARSDRRTLRIAVLREPEGRGGSRYLYDDAVVGEVFQIGSPRNNFELETAARYVFIAGGIGITPLVPMIREVDDAGADWSLLYGGRSLRSMAFVTELRDDPRVTIVPEDEMGLLDLAALKEARGDTLIYCCGPEPLLKAVELATAHWGDGALRLERFKARDDVPNGPGTAFDVILERSGIALTVAPGQSILQTVADAGVVVPSSCREGTCGTCETVVLEGEPEHRDSILTPRERAANDCIIICCSRARSDRLVLDL
jgi:ferredoxin-NADP reductase